MSVAPLLSAAKELIRAGHIAEARQLLHEAASLDEGNAEALLVLAAISPPDDSLLYARRALNFDPDNAVAQEAVRWAERRLEGDRLALEIPASPAVTRHAGARPVSPQRTLAAKPPPLVAAPLPATPSRTAPPATSAPLPAIPKTSRFSVLGLIG